MIQKINYKDFYINQKYILDESSEEYDFFWDIEEERCKEGVYVDEEFINLYLYWHLNYWHAETSVLAANSRTIEEYINLGLRDNEWVIFNAIWRAEEEKKGLCLMGSRRIAKSTFAASYIAHGATFDKNSQNIVSGLNAPDIKLITDKIDKGLNMLLTRFQWMRIEDNWKAQVSLGIKYKDGRRKPFSQILIRNLDNGNNQEAIAGTKLRKLLIDEAGKNSFLAGLQAAEPGFTTLFGWGCSLILTGTGGDMEGFADAKKLFFNLDEYNFISFKNEKTGKTHGLFLGHTFRQEAKFDGSLGEYLNKLSDSDLYNILMRISDIETANKVTEEARERKSKTGNNIDLIKEIMYFPKDVNEIFMSSNDNQFLLDEIDKILTYLKENKITGQYVRLYRNAQSKVTHKFSERGDVLITNYLAEKWEKKDTLIQVWEFLELNALWGLYVAGADPYNQSSSEYSTSLGSVIIYKRMIDISGSGYYNMLVATYAGRLKTMNEWHENVEMLLEWYNAICMLENEATTFIQYFDQKKKIHYLADGLTLAKEINLLTTTTSRIKGLAATPLNINYCMSLLYEYCKEQVQYGVDEFNNLVYKMGIWRVLDLMILEEMKSYSKDANVDRIVAFRHAIAFAKHLDKFQLVVKRKIEENEDDNNFDVFNKGLFTRRRTLNSQWLNGSKNNWF